MLQQPRPLAKCPTHLSLEFCMLQSQIRNESSYPEHMPQGYFVCE